MSKEFKDLVSFTDGPDKIIRNQYGMLQLQSKSFPWSVKEFEFDVLRSLVSTFNCKRGFEVATGFGVSAVALGLGFKETQGKLVTVDAYVEEFNNHPDNYRRHHPTLHTQAIGYRMVRYLMGKFNLENTVFPEVGWSPRDVSDILKRHLTPEEKIDFAFIDGGHFSEQVIRDVEGILPFLAPKHLIVFHDGFNQVFNSATIARIEFLLKKPMRMLVDINTGCGNNMMLVNNMDYYPNWF